MKLLQGRMPLPQTEQKSSVWGALHIDVSTSHQAAPFGTTAIAAQSSSIL